jgi:HJR/Mrr/RecB family endonuclease
MIKSIFEGLVGLCFMMYIFSLIQSWTKLPWSVIIGTVITIFLLVYFISLYRAKKEEKKRLAEPCSHGTVGAYRNSSLCSQCIYEQHERDRLAEIKRKSDELKMNEIARLKRANAQKIKYLYSLSPQDFEDVIATAFRNLGYHVEQTPYSNDGGKDAIAWKDNKKYLIECKRYANDHPIGRPLLQKFFAAMVEEKAVRGFYVTTGTFASTAHEYAKETNMELINSTKLAKMMGLAFPEAGDGNSFKVMCNQCGETVVLSFDHPETKCTKRHTVRTNIEENMLINWNATQYRQKRKRRRYHKY